MTPGNDRSRPGQGAASHRSSRSEHQSTNGCRGVKPPVLEGALGLARIGWYVHLLYGPTMLRNVFTGGPVNSPGKQPILPDWPERASTDPAVIAGWWDTWSDANVGVVTGARSGLVVLDIDPRNGGHESLAKLEERVGVLPGTAMVITGSDGLHKYYRHPGPGVKVKSVSKAFGREFPGIDVKGDGGQVVAPPSIHPDGPRYRWSGDVSGLLHGDVAGYLAPWPAEQLAPVLSPPPPPPPPRTERPRRDRTGQADATLLGLLTVVFEAPEGERNRALHWAACRVGEHVVTGLLDSRAVDALHSAGRQAGLTDRETRATVRSGLRRGRTPGAAA